MRKKLFVLLLILLCSVQTSFAGTFSDTKAFPWAEDAIENMVENGYISGYTDGTFRPEKEITRAEFVSVINKMNQFTESGEINFSDVKPTHWAYEQIKIALAAGYINGYPDGTFRPDEIIKKEQVAAMFNNLYQFENTSTKESIKDLSKVSSWAVQAVVNVISNDIMPLDAFGNFNSKVPAKRVDTVLAMNQIVVKSILTKTSEVESNSNSNEVADPIITAPIVTPPSPTPIDPDVKNNLLAVKTQLSNSVLPKMTTSKQRNVINIINSAITSYVSDTSYAIDNDVTSAKAIVSSMTDAEQDYLIEKIQFYVEIGALYELNNIFHLIEI